MGIPKLNTTELYFSEAVIEIISSCL